jgi:hypothetical protein
MRLYSLWIALGVGALAGCGGHSGSSLQANGDPGVTIVATLPGEIASIGPAGGEVVSGSSAALTVPPNALAAPTEIRLAPSDQTPPSPLNPLTAAYDLSPAGTPFPDAARPTLELALPDGVSVAVAYLSRADGTGWELVGGAVWGGSIKVQLPRFGTAFAAVPREP